MASLKILEFALRGVIFKELNAKLGGLSFLKSKKGECVLGGDEVRVLEEGDKRSSRGGMDACSSWEGKYVRREEKVTSSLRVELIKEGNFDENIMGDEMKALVSTPE